MGLKKNIVYNIVLTTSLYLFQFISYPYVARVLGVTNIGICNFLHSFISFFVLFSTMGITTMGVREIAKVNKNPIKLNIIFSRLFYLQAIFTVGAAVIYVGCIIFVPQLEDYRNYLYIGLFQIVFNLFTIEWFYRGIENFKFITYRSLIIRVLYVISIFIFIKNKDQFVLYYILSIFVVVVNGSINWIYKVNSVRLVKQSWSAIFTYLKPFIGLGIQIIMLSYFSTFNPVILAFVSNDTQVGYYTTAIKIALIVLLIYNAYTLAVLPRISSLMGANSKPEILTIVQNSYTLLYIFAIPCIFFIEIFAPEIIYIIAGPGYEGAIIPMRICLPVILLGGLTQIALTQILIPARADKEVLISTGFGAFACIMLNCFITPYLESIGSALIWIISELLIVIISNHFVTRRIGPCLDVKRILQYTVCFSPVILLAYMKYLNLTVTLTVPISMIVCVLYFHFCMFYWLKESIYISVITNLKKKLA